jgi:hypothetical protein
VLAHASWLFVTTAFVVAVAFAVMSLTLRLVPMTIGSMWGAIAIAAVIVVAVLIGVARRWPSEARIAQRIDEALELRELIATGFASTGDDAASRLVRATAVETARGIRAADVPLSRPSMNTFAAAVLILIAAMTINALIQRGPEDQATAAQSTPPNRTPAGLIDHDAVARGSLGASSQHKEPESTNAAIPTASQPAAAAATTDAASDGKTNNGDGRDRSTSDAMSNADLTFHASSGAKDDAKQGDANANASGGAPTEGDGTASATDMKAETSAPRIPIAERTDAQHSNVDRSSSARAVTHIPDRHRDLVRAYFDAAATQPSDAKR